MKGKNILKKIYKSLVLSRTASVANETLRTISNRQLDDMGLSRATFVNEIVNSVRKGLDRSENNKSRRQMISTIVNPNLVGSI